MRFRRGGPGPVTHPVHQMVLWKAAILSFLAMVAQDILGTLMVVFVARSSASEAGAMDVLGYFAGLICSVLALDSILENGWRTKRSLVLLAVISVANYLGTFAGVYTGKWIAG